MIQLRGDFSKDKGDRITFPMRAPLTSQGVQGDNDLEGNEEALTFYDYSMTLFKTRHAVRSEGELSDRRVVFEAKMQAQPALEEWLAAKIDGYTIAALSGVASADANIAASVPTTNRKWTGGQTAAGVITHYAGNTDAEMLQANIAATLFGPAVISAVKRKAKRTEPIVRPIMINGEAFYVMFIHPLQAKAFKATDEFKDAAQLAATRGPTNPIFTGALGIYDNVILHEVERIHVRTGAGGATAAELFDAADALPNGTTAARALFCGAQACVHGYGKLPYSKTKEFDYGDEWGIALGVIMAVGKPVFNSEDYGVIVVDTCVQAD